MNNNLEKAAFAIKSYQFNKVELNYLNQPNVSEELVIKIQPKGSFNEHTNRFKLFFNVSISSENSSKKILYIECVGIFEFMNIDNFQDIPDFFYNNSIALLFPYVRAYVSLITTQANIKGIILPTMNLSSLKDELKKLTIIDNDGEY